MTWLPSLVLLLKVLLVKAKVSHHGRWTEGLECEDERFPEGKTKVWKVDPEGCLAVQDEKPNQTLNYNKSTAFDGSYHNVLDN